MQTIKDLLRLDLTEDMKDVIDLEDRSETELQYEIENYIVTNKIAEHLDEFISRYHSNIKETGVWLSGFYGSGKSYFGKMLGYLLENRDVNGTPFQERFLQRLEGLPNQALLENAVRSLNQFDTLVVFLDIAKQNTNNGFAWTLFRNFLRALGFLDDVFGYMEYYLAQDGKYEQFCAAVSQAHGGKGWLELRRNPLKVPLIFREATGEAGLLDNYDEAKRYLEQRMAAYDPAAFRDELIRYLEQRPQQTRIVFIIDEVSESLNQRKINLLELEGISEALSDVPGGRVWTMAIAQEKFDVVLHNPQLNVKELNKVRDRFKTQIHLSSEEVDTVIRKRLLLKHASADQQLRRFYEEQSGLILDATSLNAKFPTKTADAETFAMYYPFHKYQFDLLQNFLFAVHQKARTGGSERGMIIAAHLALRTVMGNAPYTFVTADELVDAGKKILEGEFVRKFAAAEKVLQEQHSPLDGNKLLKTIYFLNESQFVPATPENITRAYLARPQAYYDLKPRIEGALKHLKEAMLLLEKNEVYKIASDLEYKLLEEMKKITAEYQFRERDLIELLKKQAFLGVFGKRNFEGQTYQFALSSSLGDEFGGSANKQLGFQFVSLYNTHREPGAREDFVENVKFETQGQTGLATVIPAIQHFNEIDGLIEELYRYTIMEDRYRNDDDPKIRAVIKDFSVAKANKLNVLNRLIDNAYTQGSIVYHFEEHQLSDQTLNNAAQAIQEAMIRNTYTDRLTTQLSEGVGERVLQEQTPSKLKTLFSAKEFEFFDSSGNFIGEHLRVVDRLVKQLNTKLDARELEERLASAPYGYNYGTVSTTLAVLMRAGRIILEYNGRQIYDYKDPDALKVFGKSREFRKAVFKALFETLTFEQRKQIVDQLKALNAQTILGKEFSYSTNGIELVMYAAEYAEHFIKKAAALRKRMPEFDAYFPEAEARVQILQPYAGSVSDSNYRRKADDFLSAGDAFKDAVALIQDILGFCESKLPKVKQYQEFGRRIVTELEKVGSAAQHAQILEWQAEFERLFRQSLMPHYFQLESLYQKIKDAYFQLMRAAHAEMAQKHQALQTAAQQLKTDITAVSVSANQELLTQVEAVNAYAAKRICPRVQIACETSCQNCHFALNEIIISNQGVGLKTQELENLRRQIQTDRKEPEEPRRQKVAFTLKPEYQAREYRQFLQKKLDEVRGLQETDVVVVERED